MKSLAIKTFHWLLAITFGLTLLVWQAELALAQNSPAQKQKRTNVDFEDQLVQGEVKKPELFYLLQKKQFNFGKLIKLRENFVPEMSKTAEDIEKAK
ncbi:MAG: hypothetical protein SGI74_05340 [Oligoflexia bacterium]|nr:hypothetical protein [Oligoflexia bacterium]